MRCLLLVRYTLYGAKEGSKAMDYYYYYLLLLFYYSFFLLFTMNKDVHINITEWNGYRFYLWAKKKDNIGNNAADVGDADRL